jgi:Ca2+-binding EF-hand superfamily protein
MGNQVTVPEWSLSEHSALIMAQYNVKPRHLKILSRLFARLDVNHTDKWTIIEFRKLLGIYPESLVMPCLEALIKFGSSSRDGRMSYEDFIIAVCSFCAFSKEELLQFVYIIIDADRSGVLDKQELENFYSASVHVKRRHHARQAIYPPNYMGALEEFGKGQWTSLIFEEFCLMCDLFPHLAFPAVYLQMMLRRAILGTRFWKAWDDERLRIFHLEAESKTITFKAPSLITGEMVEVVKPGRITMKELFEFTKRKGMKKASLGESEADLSTEKVDNFTKNRDTVLRRAPILNLIRNPNSVYYVPLGSFSRTGLLSNDFIDNEAVMGRGASRGGSFLGALDKANENFTR